MSESVNLVPSTRNSARPRWLVLALPAIAIIAILVTVLIYRIYRPTSSSRAIDKVQIVGFHRVHLFVNASGTQSDYAEAIYVGPAKPASELIKAISAPALQLEPAGNVAAISDWAMIENALFTGLMQRSCDIEIAMLRSGSTPPPEWTLNPQDKAALSNGSTMILDVFMMCR